MKAPTLRHVAATSPEQLRGAICLPTRAKREEEMAIGRHREASPNRAKSAGLLGHKHGPVGEEDDRPGAFKGAGTLTARNGAVARLRRPRGAQGSTLPLGIHLGGRPPSDCDSSMSIFKKLNTRA